MVFGLEKFWSFFQHLPLTNWEPGLVYDWWGLRGDNFKLVGSDSFHCRIVKSFSHLIHSRKLMVVYYIIRKMALLFLDIYATVFKTHFLCGPLVKTILNCSQLDILSSHSMQTLLANADQPWWTTMLRGNWAYPQIVDWFWIGCLYCNNGNLF